MGRVIENKPVINIWLSKYGFEYDSNCHVGNCRGFERFYESSDNDEITWVVISLARKKVYVSTELKHYDGVISTKDFDIPSNINPNVEAEFIPWLDSVVG